MASLNNYIYLFGGSGPNASCFNDLQVFDPEKLVWTPTIIFNDCSNNFNNSNNNNNNLN